MRTWMSISTLLLLGFAATNVWASGDESYTSYEAIVNELTASANDNLPTPHEDWEDVAMQGGMSFVTSYVNVAVNIPGEAPIENGAMMTGFEGHVGSNLFSKQVRGELAFRAFVPKEMGGEMQANLKDLEGRVVFLPRLQRNTLIRMGLGLGARFIDVEGRVAGGSYAYSSTDFASSVFLGFERKVSPTVSVGPDVAYRSGMDGDPLLKSSWDAAIRLNASF